MLWLCYGLAGMKEYSVLCNYRMQGGGGVHNKRLWAIVLQLWCSSQFLFIDSIVKYRFGCCRVQQRVFMYHWDIPTNNTQIHKPYDIFEEMWNIINSSTVVTFVNMFLYDYIM